MDWLSDPIVAMTANAMVGDREKMLEAAFDGYIVKPIEPVNFVSQIEQFLAPALRAQRPAEVAPAAATAAAMRCARPTSFVHTAPASP